MPYASIGIIIGWPLGEVAAFLLSGQDAAWSVRKGAAWWLTNRVRDSGSAVVLKVMIGPDFV